jgi:hypothetical protein
MQRRAFEMFSAANRLAVGWMAAAAEQHIALTAKALGGMTEAARELTAEGNPQDKAAAMLALLDRARETGLDTMREIGGMMARMQQEATALLDRTLPPE